MNCILKTRIPGSEDIWHYTSLPLNKREDSQQNREISLDNLIDYLLLPIYMLCYP